MRISIRVKGHLDKNLWQNWFLGLQITLEPEGRSLLSGSLPDQAALFGVLDKMSRLNLHVMSMTAEEEAGEDT